MDVTVTAKPETSQTELEITVPVGEFSPYLEKAARSLTKDKALPGFRPGKAPLPVVIDAFGQERVLHEAMDLALPKFFVDAIVENDIEAINRPAVNIEELGVDKPFRFKATVDIMPTVTLGDMSKITVNKKPATVAPEEVEKELNYLAKMRSTFLEVAHPAETGDTVTVDFKVTMSGQVMEGGESKNHPVHLGEGHFVPDFEKHITGMNSGEERTFLIEFPADFAKEDLRGQKAEVHVKAHSVQKRILPELNDEFAKKLGAFESMAHVKEELTKNMQHEKEHKEQERYHAELMEKMAEAASFGFIPPILLEKEIDRRLEELVQMLAYQQKTIDQYLNESKKTLAQVREEIKPAAETGVKVALAVRQFAVEQKIEVSEEEIEQEATEYLKHYKTVHQAKEAIDPAELGEQISSRLRNQKTLERLEQVVVH